MNDKKNLILVGAGGHCKSVIDVAELAGYTIVGILGRPEELGKKVLRYEVTGTDSDMASLAGKADFIVTVGQIKSSLIRIRLHEMLKEAGCSIATIISPTAYVSKYATVGEGSIVMHNAVVNADAHIGKGCIINSASVIEHEAVIGDFCHISTGVTVNGGTSIGDSTFIGSRCVINECLSIGDHAIVGSGSVVIDDLPSRSTSFGLPAKPVNTNNDNE